MSDCTQCSLQNIKYCTYIHMRYYVFNQILMKFCNIQQGILMSRVGYTDGQISDTVDIESEELIVSAWSRSDRYVAVQPSFDRQNRPTIPFKLIALDDDNNGAFVNVELRAPTHCQHPEGAPLLTAHTFIEAVFHPFILRSNPPGIKHGINLTAAFPQIRNFCFLPWITVPMSVHHLCYQIEFDIVFSLYSLRFERKALKMQEIHGTIRRKGFCQSSRFKCRTQRNQRSEVWPTLPTLMWRRSRVEEDHSKALCSSCLQSSPSVRPSHLSTV